MITRRRLLALTGAAGVASAAPALWTSARSQVVRTTTRLLVGFPPGGPVDIVARLLANEMKAYASTIIVENRPGGGGRVALEALRTGAADGSVFVISPASMIVIYPHVYKTLSYSPLRDFAPVTTVCEFSLVLAVGPRVPAQVKTVADFVAWCRANPRQATYGSPSAGAVPHFTGVMLARAAGIELLHIPYQGAAPAMQNLLGGEIAANITVLPAALPHVQAKTIRALATTGPSRSPFLPDVPTLSESGFPGLETVEWFGIFAPVKAPADIVAKLNGAVRDALKVSEVRAGLNKLSFEPAGNSPEQFTQMVRAGLERWGPIVEASGFKAEN
jgi:tripartite-type tricarboxylate transporter receptor subunit TctC